jgi:soluble lytic murein transglycosylase-like protein
MCILLACLPAVRAAEPDRAAASLEKQRQSVQRQIDRFRPSGSFFLSPWVMQRSVDLSDAPAVQADCDALPEGALSQVVASAARDSGVSPQLLRAVIRRESGGRPCAVSAKGAQGLMQLMPATQQTLGVTDPFDPASSVTGGARYLADLLKRYKGDLRRTLAAYNAGPQRVDPDGAIPDIPETRAYVAAILADIEAQQYPDP